MDYEEKFRSFEKELLQLDESVYPELAINSDLEKKISYLNALSDFFTHRKLFPTKVAKESSIEKILKKNLADLEKSLNNDLMVIQSIELSMKKDEIKEEDQTSLLDSKGRMLD